MFQKLVHRKWGVGLELDSDDLGLRRVGGPGKLHTPDPKMTFLSLCRVAPALYPPDRARSSIFFQWNSRIFVDVHGFSQFLTIFNTIFLEKP